jgi:predicted AlkP superfamily pyrophosphatase or phosphodiesterase
MAFSVYTPVTNAGMAAILTGRPPSENGVHTRKEMDILTPSIFGYAEQSGKSSVMIEGNIKVLNLEIEPVLNIDRNSSGSTDDEIRDKALEMMEQSYNLMVVHFHGIDDSGHSCGDLSPETMERVKATDGYVEQLVSRWNGRVIITADHGMHSTSGGGSHGEFRYEDMVVPYIICEGEGRE